MFELWILEVWVTEVVEKGITGLGIFADLGGAGALLLALWAAIRKLRVYLDSRSHRNVNAFVSIKMQEAPKDILSKLVICILDDEPQSFPIDHIRSMVGRLESITSIELSQMSKLEQFDIIFLDIAGVLKEDLKNGGLEILRRLHGVGKKRPLVIAVSSKTFKPEVNDFFRLADDVLNKPLSAQTTEDALVQLVLDHRSVAGWAKKVDALLDSANLSGRQHQKAVSRVVRYLQSKKNASWIRGKVTSPFGIPESRMFEDAVEDIRKCLSAKSEAHS